MNFSEECLPFDCEGDALVGVLSRPERPSSVGLVLVVGGPQYRVGSHRQFVLLARHLAAAGHAVLRFDYRGMGDAAGEARDFQAVSADIDAAISALRQAVPDVQRVTLWGLCDGASAALLYVNDRPVPAVAGLCLLNPWVRSAQTQASTRVKHYYPERLMERSFWVKLLRGRVGLGRLSDLMASLRTMLSAPAPDGAASASTEGFQQRMALAWQRSDVPILLVLSGRDLTAKEFIETLTASATWRDAMSHQQLTRLDLPEADHTFGDTPSRLAVEQATRLWLDRLAGQSNDQADGPHDAPDVGGRSN